jgi:hypothetical protein
MPISRVYWLPADNSTISKLNAIGIRGEEFAMTSDQIAIEQCAALCGLDSNDFRTDLTASAAYAPLRASYLLLHKLGWATVQALIVADIRAALDLGASKRVTDLLLVLQTFLFEHPEFIIEQHCRASVCGTVDSNPGADGESTMSMATLEANQTK